MSILFIELLFFISLIIVVMISTNTYLSNGYQVQNTSEISNQILHNQSVPINSTNSKILDKRDIALNQSKQSEKRMSSGELGTPLNGIPTNIQRYIIQLSNSSPSEISSFPINDLSIETTVNILKGLSVKNLFKVLNSISVDDLSTLLHKLNPDLTKLILNKLPTSEKSDIQNRIKSQQ